MTVTIEDLADEFFSQIRNVVTFVGSNSPNSVIEDNLMMDSNTIVHNFARLLFKYAEGYINSGGGILAGFVSMIVDALFKFCNDSNNQVKYPFLFLIRLKIINSELS
jgi:hypothetical protein